MRGIVVLRREEWSCQTATAAALMVHPQVRLYALRLQNHTIAVNLAEECVVKRREMIHVFAAKTLVPPHHHNTIFALPQIGARAD